MQATGGETQVGLGDRVKYLFSGKQTSLTPEILQMSSSIQGSTIDKTNQILGIVKKLEAKEFDEKVFRKRTGAQVIKDGYVTGCTDDALAFITLARASGIPAKYIETIDIAWLEKGGDPIDGHTYAQIYDADTKRWMWIDPAEGTVDIPVPADRVVFEEGFDSWDIGITDFDSLNEQFESFRRNWLKQHG